MMYRYIDRLTPNNFSDLLYFCYEHTDFNACIACDSVETAEKITDEIMDSFGKTSIPALKEVWWDIQNEYGGLAFFNGSRILITPASNKYKERLVGINKLLYQGEPSENFMSWVVDKVVRYEPSVSDMFRDPADNNYDVKTLRQNDESDTEALDEFLNSFKTIPRAVAAQQ